MILFSTYKMSILRSSTFENWNIFFSNVISGSSSFTNTETFEQPHHAQQKNYKRSNIVNEYKIKHLNVSASFNGL